MAAANTYISRRRNMVDTPELTADSTGNVTYSNNAAEFSVGRIISEGELGKALDFINDCGRMSWEDFEGENDMLPGFNFESGGEKRRLLLMGGPGCSVDVPKGFRLLPERMRATQFAGAANAIFRQMALLLEAGDRMLDTRYTGPTNHGPGGGGNPPPGGSSWQERFVRVLFSAAKLAGIGALCGFGGTLMLRKMGVVQSTAQGLLARFVEGRVSLRAAVGMLLPAVMQKFMEAHAEMCSALQALGLSSLFSASLATLIGVAGIVIGAYLAL